MYHFGTFSTGTQRASGATNNMERRAEKIKTPWHETFSAIPRKSCISGEMIWGSMYKKSHYTKIGIYIGETEVTHQIWKDKSVRYAQKAEERKSRVTEYATGKEIFEAKLKGEA